MPDQVWLSYLGAIAGVVGAATGIAGVVLAYLAFRRSGRLKSLDLRLELRRAVSALQSEVSDLAPLLDSAEASHTKLAAARGSYRSGSTKHWLVECAADKTVAAELAAAVAAIDTNCSRFSQAQLEATIAEVHRLQLQVAKLADKYRASIAADDSGRIQLAEDRRVVTHARIQGKN